MFFTHDRAFEELFAICIQLLNKTWKEMRATAEDFNKVSDGHLLGLPQGEHLCTDGLSCQQGCGATSRMGCDADTGVGGRLSQDWCHFPLPEPAERVWDGLRSCLPCTSLLAEISCCWATGR